MNSKDINSDFLIFNSHGVKELVLKITPIESLEDDECGEVFLNTDFYKKIVILNDSKFKVELGVKIEGLTEETHRTVISLDVCMEGIFTVSSTKFEDSYANVNAVTVLFPYLRAVVSNVTSLSNYGDIMLPPINIIKWFELETEK